MGRASQGFVTKKIVVAAAILIAVAVGAGGVDIYKYGHGAQTTVTNSQTTDVKYKGVEGQNALDLLKRHAVVEVKHYSFGDQVTSINGTQGNGPKYWSFYINGKLADVGAGSYTTKNGDSIEWKLQQL